MDGSPRRVRQDRPRIGGRLPETLPLRRLRRGDPHPAHVRCPLHNGPPPELPEYQRANPTAELGQERTEYRVRHKSSEWGPVSKGRLGHESPHL
ncbi:MAG: hypothetical protein RJA22_2031 [Verrucomicrobiota bacterium]